MKVKLACSCRGDGKAYIEVLVSDFSPHSRLLLTGSTLDERPVPTQLHVVDETEQTKRAILVFPIVLCAVRLTLHELHSDGTASPAFAKTIFPTVLKWSSRFNYRFRSERCASIRDIDRRDFFRHATIEFYECVPSDTANILRGSLYLPWAKEKPYSLTLLDDSCKAIPIDLIIMNKVRIPKSPFTPTNLQRIEFSLRIPHRIASYVLCFEEPSKELRPNFAVLEADTYSALLQEYREKTLNASNDPHYPEWYEKRRVTASTKKEQRVTQLPYHPLFSIVVPLYKTPIHFFNAMVESVRAQTYQDYELILVNADPENVALGNAVKGYTSMDHRIREILLQSNMGISKNTFEGIKEAAGEYVAFLDHDDTIEADALFEYAYALNTDPDIDLLYCDEDKLLPNGQYGVPYFKPDFSLFLLREINYVCHFLMVRKSVLDTLSLADSVFDGAQDHHLILQAVEGGCLVHHLPRVLYHWRITEHSTAGGIDNKPYADKAGRLAIEKHLERLGIDATVGHTPDACRYRVTYRVQGSPLVSIIIPSKDNKEVLDACIRSILEKSTYRNYEIIIVENNSTEEETFAYYGTLPELDKRISVIRWEEGFNFSKIINYGAGQAHGEFLLLLNNDTEVISDDWIETMLGICQQKEVGIVGAKLYYRDGTIQHAGAYVEGEAAGHINFNLDKSDYGYFNTTVTTHELSAVTGACLMVKRDVFFSIGGFDEDFAVAFNDVDFCLKVREKGLSVIFSPAVELFHYESLSRGYETTVEKQIRFTREASLLNYRWPWYKVKRDPFRSPNVLPDNCYYHLDTRD